MDVRPRELGSEFCWSVLDSRLRSAAGAPGPEEWIAVDESHPPDWLARRACRFLAGGFGIAGPDAEILGGVAWRRRPGGMLRIALVTSPIIAVLPALAVHFSGVTDIGLAKSFAFGLALAAMSVGFAVSSALGAVRDAGSATLRADEIDVLESSTSDALRRRYLALVQVVARMRIPESSAEDVRSVLRAMGDALDRLPDVAAGICDGACLQEAAATTRQQALRETDSVVANSLHGRADILERRARLQADSGHLLRRIAAARAEVDEQIQAVHEQICVLAGAEANPTVKLPIPDLAEACRRLAFLTTAMASAVEELDSAPSWVAWAPDRCSAVTVPQERIRYQTLQRKQ